MIKRNSNWPEVLSDMVAAARKRPFEFGKHDCCVFVANIVRAYTGTDLARGLRGYKNAAGATRMLRKNGKGTLLRTMQAVMKKHDCPKVKTVKLLKRGDVCMVRMELPSRLQRQPRGGKTEWVVGICVGRYAAFASDGVALIPIENVNRGWHVG